MTISEAQLRTLRLLDQQAAHRVYRSQRAGDYTWTHEDSRIALTPTLHGYSAADMPCSALVTGTWRS